MKTLSACLSLLALALNASSAASLPVAKLDRKSPVDFPEEVYPILKANCIACHNKTTTKGGLNMETPQLMEKGGDSGTAVVPGKGAESLLFQSAIHESDSEMPPKGNKVGAVNLTPDELALLKLWIDQGAKPGKAISHDIAWKPLPSGLLPIYAAAISPDGTLAACSRANHIFIYDLATRQLVADLQAHRDMTMALAFSPDGQRLVSGSYGEVKVWQRSTELLASGADFKKVQDARVKLDQSDRDVAMAVLDAAFHVSAVAEADKEVAALKERFKKAGEAVTDTKKKLDEKKTALKSATDARTAAQKAVTDLDAQVAKVAPPAKPDAALLKKQTDAKTKLEAATKAEMAAAENVKAAETAATDAANEVPRVTKLQAEADKAATVAKAAQTAFLAKQKTFVAGQTAAAKTMTDALKAAATLVISPDQRFAVEPQADGSAVVWSLMSGVPLARCVPKPGTKAAVTWKPDNQMVLPAEAKLSSLASTWKLERTLGTGDAKSDIADRVNAVDFSPDGKTLAVGSGEPSRTGDITIWDLASGKLVRAMHDLHSDTVLSLDFSPDGKLMASGGADKQVRVSDVATGKQVKVFEGHTHHVMGVSWRADGRVLASSGADNAAKVWDWVKGERKKSLDGWDKEVTSIRYLGATTRLVTTSGDKQVRLIGEDGSSPSALAGTADFMQASAATRDGRWAVAGGEDSVLRVWDTKSAAAVGVFAKP